MTHRTYFRWLLAFWLLLLLLVRPPVTDAQAERLVLAFYYAWYDDNTWAADQVPDMPLSPYRSADRATIERHVSEARSAGIDAFVQSWYGPGDNPTERNFKTLLDVAQAAGFKATVDLEVGSPLIHNLDDLKSALRHVIDVHAGHPAFLRYGGKPVILFWQNNRHSLNTWQAIRAEIDPQRQAIWIAEGDDPRWLGVFDGLHMYTITWAVNTNPEYTASKMRKRVDEYNAVHSTQRSWVATAMPGYDDTYVAGRANTYVYPRSTEYYRETWNAAMSSAPEMIIITSYNEWCEGTMIEPSVTYGRTYLDLTRELAALYKGSSVPSVAISTATALPTDTPTAVPTATVSPTDTPFPSPTPSPTLTPTLVMPTNTPMLPTPTATSRPTSTATPVPTATDTPIKTATIAATATASFTPPATSLPDVASPPCWGATGWVVGLLGWIVFRCKFRVC
ncbi:MAG: glycoside hydrolase family 99-like domain-containing protein [Anaerolineae bacterium]|nr:glycoside hydrolase family 99-like domain-containing protein [Anaerolineae bacterium]